MTIRRPVFPQPVRGFAGRRAELDRILAHVDQDVLFLLYGVGGIGKTELAYQLVREIRERARWADAIPVLVEIRPGTTAPRTLAQLLAAVGSAPAPRRGQPTEKAHLSEQLALLARRLDARPYLLLVDDVHHLPAGAVGEALGYLSRRVERSRLVVISRLEIPLPAEAPPPVVTTLGPLDAEAAAQMMTALAERLQVPRPEPGWLMRTTHGSPFHIHRALVRHAPGTGSLEASLDELSPAARRVLLAASVAQHRPPLPMLPEDAVGELAQRFLVQLDRGQLVVHDLVREALLGAIAPATLAAAHADAAALCLAELHAGDDPRRLLAVDAVHHLLAAGRPLEAWRVIETWRAALAAAGSEHLLLDPLERLRAALPARQVAIDLLIARTLVRASLFEEAGRALARLGEPRDDADEARACLLAGEIAQQGGDLAGAGAHFERAVALAPDPEARFRARLRSATVAINADEGDRARRMLDAALDELPAPTPRHRARAAWARTASWMVDERFENAAEEAGRARRELDGTGLDDLASQLAMLETLACIESDDMVRARDAARRIDEAGLRRRVAALYRAIVRHADGEARDAGLALARAHEELRGHGDTVNAYLAGFHGSAALAEAGLLGEAQALAERTSELARRAGLRGPAARSLARQARFAAEAMQPGAAHRLADQALAGARIGPRARAEAHCAHARACTIEGDITRALAELARARAAVVAPDLTAARAAIEVEHAAIELVGGDLERAVERAERAVAHYRGRSRDYQAAHAQLVLGAAYIARGRRTDLLYAERTVGDARGLADRGGYRSIQVGCAILAAALAKRSNRDRAARELLAEALRDLDPERGSLYAGVLVAAIDGGAVALAAPGAVALLAHLGFCDSVQRYLVDQHGRRAATDRDVARERELRELLVDEVEAVIVARRGALEIRGRPMLCALLSVLVEARGEPVAPDTLYTRVWGVAEYHPLQHRNTLYVAINRLRSCLREALPEREVIERTAGGWRLAEGVDACAAIGVRGAV